jgi:uncharacterized membrane protein YoaK (UPF0700 family)
MRWKLTIFARPSGDVLLLSLAAGALDALSYLFSGVFTANMTGNTVLLGLGLVGFDWTRAERSALALGAFAVGALVAGLLLLRDPTREWPHEMRVGLAVEVPLLVVFGLLYALSPEPMPGWIQLTVIAVSACALGVQSVAVRRLKTAGVVTTFITGTITAGVMSLLSETQPGGETRERGSPVLLGAMFACYVAGAGIGGMLAPRPRVMAAVIPLVLVAAAHLRSFRGATSASA